MLHSQYAAAAAATSALCCYGMQQRMQQHSAALRGNSSTKEEEYILLLGACVCARALVCSVDGSYVAAHTSTTAILVVVHYEEGWAEAERYLHRTAS